MMNFVHTAYRSLTEKRFYAEIIKGDISLKSGFWFIFKIQILAALFMTILLSANLVAFLPWLRTTGDKLLEPGTEIVLRGGVLKTNANPIVIAIRDIKNGSTDTTAPDVNSALNQSAQDVVKNNQNELVNLLVIDTTASTTLEALDARKTFVLVTQEGMVIKGDRQGNAEITMFSGFKDFDLKIDQQWVKDKTSWIIAFSKFIPFIAFFFFLIVMYMGTLIAALIYALFTHFVFRAMKEGQSFKTSMTIGLYSRVFATVLGIIGFIIPIIRSNLFLIPLELIFIIYMIKDIKIRSKTDVVIENE